MLQFPPWKILLIVGVVLWGCLLALPNMFTDIQLGEPPARPATENSQELIEWENKVAEAEASNYPGFLPKQKLNLGLDLQGGVYLLIELDEAQVAGRYLRNFSPDLNDAMQGRRGGGELIGQRRELVGDKLVLTLTRDWSPETIEETRRRIRRVNPVLEGSISQERMIEVEQINDRAFELTLTENAKVVLLQDAQGKSMEVIRRRIDPDGVREISIAPQGNDRIVLEAPGVDDPQSIKSLLDREGLMYFAMSRSQAEGPANTTWRLLPFYGSGGEQPLWVNVNNPIVTGDDIRSASQGFDEYQRPQINFNLKASGTQSFSQATVQFPGQLFAIVLDDEIMSAPRINDPIFGAGVRITGNFEMEEAIRLAAIIEAGALPAKLNFIEERTVSASLGEDSIRAGTLASMIGLLLVAAFMIIAYGIIGLFAVVSLTANIILILGGLSFLGATLTLPGIAGIILTIGMAVDANVLVFERIREEYRGGRSPVTAVQAGYERALATILDANITTFIAAAVLYWLAGSGPVKGFATTLGLGIVTSVFTAFVFTRLLTAGWLRYFRPKALSV